MKSQNNGAQQVMRKTIISAAAAATLGMMSNGVQAVHIRDNRDDLMRNRQYLQTGSRMSLRETPEGGPDSISMSSTDDMFAFSQIVAGGQNPLAVANALERDLANAPKTANGGLDEDQAVAAYSEFMTGAVTTKVDPASIEAELKRKAAEQKADSELKQLQENDSTSAFASLVESQAIESKAESFKGSAPEEQDDDPVPAALPQKKAPETKALIAKKILASKLKPRVLPKKAPRPPKQDISLLDQKQEILLSDPQVGAKQSKLQGVIDQLRAGKTVEEVRNGQKALAQQSVSVLAPAPAPVAMWSTPAALPQKKTFSLAIPSKGEEVTQEAAPEEIPKADDANVDAQADEIIAQIKSAAANLKTAHQDSDSGTQTAALRALATADFVQLSSEINIENDPNADIALGYLASQFPEEYPEPKEAQKEKPLSDYEKLQIQKKEMVQQSQEVLSAAVDSDNEMKEHVQKEEDATKSAFEIAGMPQARPEKPGQHAEKKQRPAPITLTLAQVSSDVDQKHKQKSDTLSDLGLTEQQLAIIDQYTSINENELNNQASNSNLIDKNNQDIAYQAALKIAPALDSLADLTSDSDNMKSYSESVAQAADVVSKESEAADPLDTSSLTELKMQAREAAKLDASTRSQRPPTLLEKYGAAPAPASDPKSQELAKKVDDKMQADLEAKAAIVAQAEAANSAAIDSPTGSTVDQKYKAAQPIDASKQSTQSKESLDSTEQQEKLKQQQKLQFEADKQSALDQGYTADQAEQYANQEAFAAAQQQQNLDASKSPALQDTQRPASGPLLTPPTQPGENQAGAMKTAEPSQAAQASQGEESSISLQAQIEKAQRQQDELKAAVAQRKQQLETSLGAADPKAQAVPQTGQTQAQPDQAAAQSQETQQEIIQQQASQESGSSSISKAEERRVHLQKEAEEQASKEAQEIYEQQMAASNQQSAVANTAQAADIQPIVAQKAAETPSQNPIQTPIVKAQERAVLNPTQDAATSLQRTPIASSKKNIQEVSQEQAPMEAAQEQVSVAMQKQTAAAVQQQAPAPIQEQAPLVVQQATAPAPEQAQATNVREQAPAAAAQEQVPAVAAQEQAPVLPAQEQAPAAVPQVVQEQEPLAARPQATDEVPQEQHKVPIAYGPPNPAQLQDASLSIGQLQQQKQVLQQPTQKVMPAPSRLTTIGQHNPQNQQNLKTTQPVKPKPKQAVATQKPELKTAVKKEPMKIYANMQKKLAQPIKQVQKEHALPSKKQAAPMNVAPKQVAQQKEELNTKLAKKAGPIKNIQNSPTAKVLKKADNVETQSVAQVAKEIPPQENAQNLNKEPISKLPKAKSAKHDAKIQNLQEKADIHEDDGSQLQKVPEERLLADKKNAKQYEKDLNKARSEIERAQNEMKTIDSEVGNFHQKMAKSMHSLLQAFSDGFEAMDQAKADEGEEMQVIQIQRNEDKKGEAKTKELEKETSGSRAGREQRDKERYQKLDKIHSSISNLQELTSKLKMSFSDDQKSSTDQKQNADQEHIQTKQDIQTQEPNTLEDKKQKQAVVTNAQKSAVKAQPSLKDSRQLAQTKTAQNKSIVQKKLNTISTNKKIVNEKIATKGKVLLKAVNVKDQANNNKKVIALNKMKQPKLQRPALAELKTTGKQKIATTNQGKALVAKKLATTASTTANLKAKMKALLTASAKKKVGGHVPGHSKVVATKLPQLGTLIPKKINNHPLAAAQIKQRLQKPLQLAQTMSGADEEEQAAQGLQALSSMQQLFSTTSKQLQGISAALGKGSAGTHQIGSVAQSLGIKMDEKTKQEAAKLGSNQLIAHAMADRIMAQLDAGKEKGEIEKDLTRTKQALILAQKAFYDKDPEAIEYLQLDETEAANSNDKVYIYSENGSGSDSQVDDTAVQLQESDSDQIGTSPEQNEDEVQAMLAADEHTEELSKKG